MSWHVLSISFYKVNTWRLYYFISFQIWFKTVLFVLEVLFPFSSALVQCSAHYVVKWLYVAEKYINATFLHE